MMLNKVSLTLQDHHHRELEEFLFPGDGLEAIAFVVCTQHESHGRLRLLSKRIFMVPYSSCISRSKQSVSWPTEAIETVLNVASEEGLSVVKIHSHPSGVKQFSSIDDKADRALFPGIHAWVNQRTSHVSAVMLPGGSVFGRVVDEAGQFEPLDLISVANADLQFWYRESSNDNIPESASRITQAFGEGTYGILRRLRIGVVGCSGTGVPIITGLNLNHVAELFLVDPDHIENANRNRIPTATADDVEAKTPKVLNQKYAVELRGLGTRVVTFQADVCDQGVVSALGSCDILIGCVDSANGRHLMNKISSAFLIPYIDLGVRIDADGTGGVNGVYASAHFVTPGGSSLLSRGVYTMEQLYAEDMKNTDPAEYERQHEEGYVKGIVVERPAVASINAVISSLVLEDLLARLHGYRYGGNEEFAIRRVHFCMGEITNESDTGFVCPIFIGLVARGGERPLLGLPFLEAVA